MAPKNKAGYVPDGNISFQQPLNGSSCSPAAFGTIHHILTQTPLGGSEPQNEEDLFMQTFKTICVCVLCLLFCLFAATSSQAAEKSDITLGSVSWPGVTVKTEIAKQILETLGYEVEVMELAVAPTLMGVANGNLDAFLGCWLPNQITYMDKYLDKGVITKLTQNLDQTTYCHGVPEYVWDAGVRSMADLDKPEFRDKFDLNGNGKPELYGIEAGNVGNKITTQAIEDDTYGLGDWEFVPSSTSGMLSQVKKATRNNEWIVFQAWEPHWMVIEWDLKFLEDPEEIWPGKGRNTDVWTVIHTGFEEQNPNVVKFLEQMKILPEWQSNWIYDFSYAKKDQDDVARKWIQHNMDVIAMWTYGVKSVDGQRARDVLRAAFQD
jgi:glycine betaine/proline transport system substrate-binding protein